MSSSTPVAPWSETYDVSIAAAMTGSASGLGGIPAYLGIRTVEVGPGTLLAEMDVVPELLNPFGSAHGGTLAALTDHAIAAVLYPLIPQGSWAATTEFTLNFLAPVRTGVLAARAQVISMSKRTAVVRIDAHNEDRLVGAAQGTVTISPPRSR
jgi:uncharacterized protein (TIGR00369 family)